ncbi:histidine kinase, partial [Clostridium perfringens]|nr:histidine kinase [Clostridium perfringens]
MRKKLKFEHKIILSSIVIAFIPLILSYIIFINEKISYIDDVIKSNLKHVGFTIGQSELIQNKLYNKENDGQVQE